MGKKKEYKPDYYASLGNAKDTFSTLYDSMITSEKFKQLSLPAKNVYYLCRNQYTSRRGRECLYNHAKEYGITYPDGCFVFPAKHSEVYGLKRAYVSKYLTELEKAGFIKRYENNKHTWKVNVYQFSTEWKN